MRRGFTLIELLVVIAIIAILAAILFPVFAKAREKARQSSCLSNVKQIMLGVMSYAQDYDETLPYQVLDLDGSSGANAGDMTWRMAVTPYCKNVQIFMCPSKKMTTAFGGTLATDWGFTAGYGMNAVHWVSGNPQGPSGAAMGTVEYPAQCVFIAETDGSEAFANDGTNVHYANGGTAWNGDIGLKRHNEGGNYGFVDGHAKWYKSNSIKCSNGDCWFSVTGT